jgi:hypothetical protein
MGALLWKSIICPVVELGRSGRLMASHLLGVIQPAVVFQINGDACCSPSVTSDRGASTVMIVIIDFEFQKTIRNAKRQHRQCNRPILRLHSVAR